MGCVAEIRILIGLAWQSFVGLTYHCVPGNVEYGMTVTKNSFNTGIDFQPRSYQYIFVVRVGIL